MTHDPDWSLVHACTALKALEFDEIDLDDEHWHMSPNAYLRRTTERLASAAFGQLPRFLHRLHGELVERNAIGQDAAVMIDGISCYAMTSADGVSIILTGASGVPYRLSGKGDPVSDDCPLQEVVLHRLDPAELGYPYPERLGGATMSVARHLAMIGQPTLNADISFLAREQSDYLFAFLDLVRTLRLPSDAMVVGTTYLDSDYDAVMVSDGGLPGPTFAAIIEEQDLMLLRAAIRWATPRLREATALARKHDLVWERQFLAHADTDRRGFALPETPSLFCENVDLISEYSSMVATVDDDGSVMIHALNRDVCDREAFLSGYRRDAFPEGTHWVRYDPADDAILTSPGYRESDPWALVHYGTSSFLDAIRVLDTEGPDTDADLSVETDFSTFRKDFDEDEAPLPGPA